MISDRFTFTSKADGLAVAVNRWAPDAPPRAVVQIAHGMAEHADRYARFAAALCDAGYAVYANDHRGHGKSAPGPQALGDFGAPGWPGLVADMVQLSEQIRDKESGRPLVLFGHSMGSFAAQQYVLDHSGLIDGLILSGSSAVDQLAVLAASGADVSFSGFNAAFEPVRTDFDWLSRDPAEVDAYVADPLCGFEVAPESMMSLMMAGERLADPAAIGQIRKDLPVLVFSGALDPVHGNLEFLKLVVSRYREAGLQKLSTKYYDEGRHEMLNEINRADVTADFLTWLQNNVA